MVDVYVDTSALLKRYRIEPGSTVMRALFDQRPPDDQIMTSQFAPLEATGVLSRLTKGRVIRSTVRDRLLATMFADAGNHFGILEITSATISRAIRLATVYALTGGDALHLSSALIARETFPDLTFVSSDDDLVKSAASEGFTVLDPLEHSALEALESLLS